MKAGIGLCDLSPKNGVDLGGYPYFYRQNIGTHDPIFGAVLYLADEAGNDVLLLISDLFYFTKSQLQRLKSKVATLSDFDPARIILSCSHSHSAPWMSAMFESFPGQVPYSPIVDEEYIQFVIDRYAETAAQTLLNSFEAELGYVKTRCGAESGIGGNRRDPENGAKDDELPILLVRDKSGTIRAIYTKYALHPTILHGESTLVSADYPGAMRAYLQEHFPEAVFLFSQGTSGDQSPRYFRKDQNFNEVERFGRTLGQHVAAAIPSANFTSRIDLRLATRGMDLVLKQYGDPELIAERVALYRAREAELIAQNAPYTEVQTANLWLLGAECEHRNALMQQDGRLLELYNACAPYEVSVLALNELAYVFLPGEIFCEFGLTIKRLSPYAETHVLTLANGDLPGYCVTQAALDEGGYEPWNSILHPCSGDVIVETALALLTDIKNRSI